MIYLLIGSSASGKSALAEDIVTGLGRKKRYYIATMMPYGEEGAKRVKRHRALREGKGFHTRERYLDLSSFVLDPEEKGGTALLECMSNLCANEVFDPSGAGPEHACETILMGVKALEKQVDDLVIVSNDVFSDGIRYDAETTRYLEVLGNINVQLAEIADVVIEAVCGIPVFLKGNKTDVEFL